MTTLFPPEASQVKNGRIAETNSLCGILNIQMTEKGFSLLFDINFTFDANGTLSADSVIFHLDFPV